MSSRKSNKFAKINTMPLSPTSKLDNNLIKAKEKSNISRFSIDQLPEGVLLSPNNLKHSSVVPTRSPKQKLTSKPEISF